MDLAQLQKNIASQGNQAPIDTWTPEFCGDIDLVIKRDGSWHYMGSPVGRPALVKLFASVLKKEGNDYFLVTPIEKVGIRVEDVPFVVSQWQQQGDFLIFTTSVGDDVIVSEENPVTLRFNQQQQDQLPYVLVRRNLWARLHQNVFYQLVEMGDETTATNQQKILQLRSGEYYFSLGTL